MLYIFKMVSVLTYLKIVLFIVPINCKHFVTLLLQIKIKFDPFEKFTCYFLIFLL